MLNEEENEKKLKRNEKNEFQTKSSNLSSCSSLDYKKKNKIENELYYEK